MACHACGLHHPNACEVCGAVGDLSECGGLTRRVAKAVAPLAGEHAGVVVDELQRLVLEAQRVTADIEAARQAGEATGRIEAIRAEVGWALRHMRREARGLQANADGLAAEARWLMAIDEPLADDEEAMPAHAVRSQVNAGRLYAMARATTERVAQTERWLEATR